MIAEITKHMESECRSAVEALRSHYKKLRTGRANVGVLDDIRVDYYGTLTPLAQVANLAAPESNLITVQPWDAGSLKAIEKAIQASDLGLTPNNDGRIIRVVLPALSTERRKELIKTAKHQLEECRVGIRNHRREANEAAARLLKDKKAGEDDTRRVQDEIQKIHDAHIKNAEEVFHHKEKELLEV